jgi:sterol desaturase/sphingolipid hydroxylase (fatty acid hydroxylase superfamily)
VIVGLVTTALVLDRSPLVVVPLLFVLVVPFEKLFPRHPGQRVRRPQLGTDLAYALAGPALNVISITVAVVVGVLSLAWVPGLALRPVVALVPPAVEPILAAVLFDLAIYWLHRWSHEVPLLWRFHAVHHSIDHLDWISGFRVHPLDGALVAPPFIFLLAAGFDPEVAGALAIIQIVLGLFLHANVRWRLRLLHRVVITPELHHWHHTNDPDAIHSNYSVFLPLWDQLFGTYFMPTDRRPEEYGIDEYMPEGIVAQLRYPFRGMGDPLRFLRHPWRSLRALVGHVRMVSGQIRRSTTMRRQGTPRPTVSSARFHVDEAWPPPTGLPRR